MKKTIKIMLINAVIIVAVFISGASSAQKQKILIIQSYHPSLAWTVQCDKGIQSVLGQNYTLSFFYMDTKRIPKQAFSKRADMAWGKYLNIKPDLVMLGDDNALRLLGKKFSKTQTPVVFFGINNNPRFYFDHFPPNITGVLERTPVKPLLRFLLRLFPNAEKCLILMDSSPTSDAIIQIVFEGRELVEIGGLTAAYKKAKNWSDWNDIVLGATNYDLLIMPTFHSVKDETGKTISVNDIVEWTSANSSIPVFSNQDYTVSSNGVVGAYVIYGESHGRLAGEIALELLEKKSQMIMMKTDRRGKLYFNQEQLNRFGINLPDNMRKRAVFR